MENNKELKDNSKKSKANPLESSMEQIASNEYQKAQTRILGGRSIDRGNPEDEDENIQSDDEGMIEEIVTTVEQDKDLECKVKKKIETKKTIAQNPETHNTITKVVKTEVTEITRTITINDHHDLERAKRELEKRERKRKRKRRRRKKTCPSNDDEEGKKTRGKNNFQMSKLATTAM